MIDNSELTELVKQIRELDGKASRDWTPFRCDWAEEDDACGIRSPSDHPAHGGWAYVIRDLSRDECGHPAALVDMEIASLLRNNATLIAECLERYVNITEDDE